MFKSEKVKLYLEALLKQHQDVEKVIICVDSECTAPSVNIIKIRALAAPRATA